MNAMGVRSSCSAIHACFPHPLDLVENGCSGVLMAYGVEAACRGLAIAALAGILVGCGGDGSDSATAQMAPPSTMAPEPPAGTAPTTPPTNPPPAAAANSAPTIAGTAATTAEVGKAYT